MTVFVGRDVPVIKDGYETSVPGSYLIADLSAVRKGGSINLAFNRAQEAMRNICTDRGTSATAELDCAGTFLPPLDTDRSY